MTSTTLRCKIIVSDDIPMGSMATFDALGQLLVAETLPGFRLPDKFLVEIEEGVELSVVRSGEVHSIDEDDMDMFVAMVYG
jgi:hypothetical protein